MQPDSYWFTSPGGRPRNEDACGVLHFENGGLYVLADGLGGTVHGEQAAQCVIEAMTAQLPSPELDPADWLETRLLAAQTQILALQQSAHANMKSTAVALLLQGDRATWAHVGDSRLYWFHDRELAAVTEDHSVAYKKHKAGKITRAQIPLDPDQNILLRALGSEDRHQPVLSGAQVQPGDAFLLCSDGAWEYLPDGEILIDLLKTETAQAWGEQLLTRILTRIAPGNDNLSLITVRI